MGPQSLKGLSKLDANWSIKCSTEATKENIITKILAHCLNTNKQTVLLGKAPFNIVDISIEVGTTKRNSIESSFISMPSENKNQSSNFMGMKIRECLAEAFNKGELPFSVKFDTVFDEKASIKIQLNIHKNDYNENTLVKAAMVIWKGIISDFRFNGYNTPSDKEIQELLEKDKAKKVQEENNNAASDIFASFFSREEAKEEPVQVAEEPVIEPEVVVEVEEEIPVVEETIEDEEEEVVIEPQIKMVGGLINALHEGKDYTDEVFLITAGGSKVGGPTKGLGKVAAILSNGYKKKDVIVTCLTDNVIVFERKAKTN